MFESMSRDVGKAAAQAAPPVGVSAAMGSGYSLQEWVYIVTIAYVVAQFAYLLWRWFIHAMVKKWRHRHLAAVAPPAGGGP